MVIITLVLLNLIALINTGILFTKVRLLESRLSKTETALIDARAALLKVITWARAVTGNQPIAPTTKDGKQLLVSYEEPGQA